MNCRLVFFSGTGNTSLVSNELAGRLKRLGHAVTLVSLGPSTDPDTLVGDADVLGFGFPVYKFTFPDYFRRFFPALNGARRVIPFFVYATYARFTADCFADFCGALDPAIYHPVAARHFKAPENGIASRKAVDDFEYRSVMFFGDNIAGALDSFVGDIVDGVERHGRDGSMITFARNPLGALRLRVVHDIEKTKYPRLRIDQTRCDGCGLCARNCPEGNISMDTGKANPVDAHGCLHCLRCMHGCHRNAIAFGALTEGDNRYTQRVRDELYRIAAAGTPDPYWADFRRITAAWRRKTLWYWLERRTSRCRVPCWSSSDQQT